MAIFKRWRPPNVMSCFAVFASLLWFMVLSTSAQPGYLSIDCGLSGSGFNSTIGINWVPDDGYISTGQIATVPDSSLTGNTLGTVRYFPENITKNCYDLSPVKEGNPYMVRPSFYYGNYDKKNSPPTFALIIDGTVMDSSVPAEDTYYEIYMIAKSSSINVCLGRSTADKAGNPFISSLELRPLPSGSSYDVVLQQGYGLYGIFSWDLGASSSEELRYPDDKYDRIWVGVPSSNGNNNKTTEVVVVEGGLAPSYPPALMFQTGIQVDTISFNNLDGLSNYHVVMFFAEISALVTQAGDRVFNISSNYYYQGSNLLVASVDIFSLAGGQYIAIEIPSPFPLTPSSIEGLIISFTASSLSTYAPFIAGIQLMLYTQDPMANLTDSNDDKAINSIRDYYKIGGSSGDPCLPTNYTWSWITCDTNKSPPRIISILLSKAGLKGNISTDFNSLTALIEIHLDNNELTGSIPDLSSLSVLQKLDLQNNLLSGTIPASLAKLPSLTELFLQNNGLQGQVPSDLLQKANDNELNLNFEGNNIICNGSCSSSTPPPSLTPPPSMASKTTNHIGLIIGIVVKLILLVIII